MPENLEMFLKGNLKTQDYETLYVKMGVSKTRLTQMKNNPASMTFSEIVAMTKAVGKDTISEIDLVRRFRCGFDTITAKEINILHKKKTGKSLPYYID